MVIHNLMPNIDPSLLLLLVILYIGPETFLPLASALAAMAGVAMMFFHRIVALVRKGFRFCSRKVSKFLGKSQVPEPRAQEETVPIGGRNVENLKND
jgi:hypothetical protein